MKRNTLWSKLLVIMGLVSAGLLFVIMTTTTPSGAGAFGILAVFVLGYVFFLSLLTLFLWALSRFISRIGPKLFGKVKAEEPLSFKKSYYYSTVIALAPIIIISLQSVGGVGPYELLLIGFFIALGCVYITKRVP